MDIQALVSLMRVIQDHDMEIMVAKSHDYAGETDALSNLRESGLAGIVIRMGDKLARLRQFVAKGVLAVNTETVHDTLMDLRNYAVLAEALLDEAENAKSDNGCLNSHIEQKP